MIPAQIAKIVEKIYGLYADAPRRILKKGLSAAWIWKGKICLG
jgi:hypothetical protein